MINRTNAGRFLNFHGVTVEQFDREVVSIFWRQHFWPQVWWLPMITAAFILLGSVVSWFWFIPVMSCVLMMVLLWACAQGTLNEARAFVREQEQHRKQP